MLTSVLNLLVFVNLILFYLLKCDVPFEVKLFLHDAGR